MKMDFDVFLGEEKQKIVCAFILMLKSKLKAIKYVEKLEKAVVLLLLMWNIRLYEKHDFKSQAGWVK